MQDVSVQDIVAGLGDAGSKFAFRKVKGQKVTVYIKVTKCSRYSRIKISGGNLAANSVTSNKELIMPDGELQVVMVPVWDKKKVLFTNLQILV